MKVVFKIKEFILSSKIKRLFIRTLKIGAIGVCSVLLLTLVINLYVKGSVSDRILSLDEAATLEDVDCILVLGCGVWNDTPSHLLADRLEKSIQLYNLGVSEKLLMSGDHGRKDYNEVSVMKQYAVSSDISTTNIFMDHAGFSTYESMYRAREVFGAKKIVIVTQEYHMSRALYIANSLGIDAYGVSADHRVYAAQKIWDAREVLARVKDFFYTIVKPLPTYLGDAIDLAGNGDVTNDENDIFYYGA